MQLIQLLTYGKLKESYLRAACAEYEKRLSRFCKLQCVELEPVALPERPSEKEITAALEKESTVQVTTLRDLQFPKRCAHRYAV